MNPGALCSGAGVALAVCVTAVACGGEPKGANAPGKQGGEKTVMTGDDRSRCDFQGRTDREVVESSGPGAFQPNVRRVYGILGEGEDRRRVLLCREIDTNLDGVKDVVRSYNDKGEALEEQADSNYDGKIDTWIRFAHGRISKVEIDRARDGRPDETRYYVKGKLSRIQRDSNKDGKADVWEIYAEGRLERMGVDTDFDGRVDRWDRDEIARRLADEKEREEEERREKEEAAKKGANDGGPTDEYVSPRNR